MHYFILPTPDLRSIFRIPEPRNSAGAWGNGRTTATTGTGVAKGGGRLRAAVTRRRSEICEAGPPPFPFPLCSPLLLPEPPRARARTSSTYPQYTHSCIKPARPKSTYMGPVHAAHYEHATYQLILLSGTHCTSRLLPVVASSLFGPWPPAGGTPGDVRDCTSAPELKPRRHAASVAALIRTTPPLRYRRRHPRRPPGRAALPLQCL